MAGNPSPAASRLTPPRMGREGSATSPSSTSARPMPRCRSWSPRTPRCWPSAATPTQRSPDGPYPHLDATGIWDFLCDALAGLNREAAIDAIAITAHGSAGAFLRAEREGDGLTMPILDYEHPGPDEFTAEYDAARPPFSETLSPRLPAGLNLGAQFFWQERRFPEEFAAATAYVNYPQYWAWRLSGVAATEMCSMGAHSDMWDPRRLRWSSMVEALGWTRKLAPLRPAFDRLGPIRQLLAARLGLESDGRDPVRHPRLQRLAAPASEGAEAAVRRRLDGHLGDPFRCRRRHRQPRPEARHARQCQRVRRSGARAAASWAGASSSGSPAASPEEPTAAELARVLAERIMALPTFVSGCGPFPSRQGPLDARPCVADTPRTHCSGEPLSCPDDSRIVDARGRVRPYHRGGTFRAKPAFLQSAFCDHRAAGRAIGLWHRHNARHADDRNPTAASAPATIENRTALGSGACLLCRGLAQTGKRRLSRTSEDFRSGQSQVSIAGGTIGTTPCLT